MVSFNHNESEITTWIGYCSENKSTKLKATLLRQKHIF